MKFKREMARGLAIALMAASVPVSAYGATIPSEMTAGTLLQRMPEAGRPKTVQELFDAPYYSMMNPDLAQTIGSDPAKLWQHFQLFGISEKRRFSPYLDLWSYIEKNPDLQAAFGQDYDRYVEHFFRIGMEEGRDSFATAEDLTLQERIHAAALAAGEGGQVDLAAVYEQYKNEKADALIAAAWEKALRRQTEASPDDDDDSSDVIIPAEYVTQHTIESLMEKCGDNVLLFTEKDDSGNSYVLFVGGCFSDVTVQDEKTAAESIECMKELIGFPEDGCVLKLNRTGLDSNQNSYYRFSALDTEKNEIYQNVSIILTASSDGQVLSLSSTSYKRFQETVPDQAFTVDGLTITYNGNATTYADENAMLTAFAELTSELGLEAGVFVGTPHSVFDPDQNINVVSCYVRPYAEGSTDENPVYADYVIEYRIPESLKSSTTIAGYYAYREDGDYSNSYTLDYFFDANSQIEIINREFVNYFGEIVSLPTVTFADGSYMILDQQNQLIAIESAGSDESLDSMDMLLFDDSYTAYVEAYKNAVDKDSVLTDASYSKWVEYNKLISSIETLETSANVYKSRNLDLSKVPIFASFLKDIHQDNDSMLYEKGVLVSRIYNNDSAAEFDGISHELGHGVLSLIVGDFPYVNATGAINESYADILGNTLEAYAKVTGVYAGDIALDQWVIGDFKGNHQDGDLSEDPDYWEYGDDLSGHYVIRSMTDPESHGQPSYVGEEDYFRDPIDPAKDDGNSDHGGVHGNSGILNQVAARMYNELLYDGEQGEEAQGGSADSYLKLFDIWYDSLQYLNVDSTYESVSYGVQQSMANNGYDEETIKKVSGYFDDAKVQDYSPAASGSAASATDTSATDTSAKDAAVTDASAKDAAVTDASAKNASVTDKDGQNAAADKAAVTAEVDEAAVQAAAETPAAADAAAMKETEDAVVQADTTAAGQDAETLEAEVTDAAAVPMNLAAEETETECQTAGSASAGEADKAGMTEADPEA